MKKKDYKTIEAFVDLFGSFEEGKAAQTRVFFEYLIENIEARYKKRIDNYQELLSIKLQEAEEAEEAQKSKQVFSDSN